MSANLADFREALARQTGQLRAMNRDVEALQEKIHDQHANSALLDDAAVTLAETSARTRLRVTAVLQ